MLGEEYSSRQRCVHFVKMGYLKYIQDWVYTSTFDYLPADVYKLYQYFRVMVQWRWKVQQSTTLNSGSYEIFKIYTRLRVQHYI